HRDAEQRRLERSYRRGECSRWRAPSAAAAAGLPPARWDTSRGENRVAGRVAQGDTQMRALCGYRQTDREREFDKARLAEQRICKPDRRWMHRTRRRLDCGDCLGPANHQLELPRFAAPALCRLSLRDRWRGTDRWAGQVDSRLPRPTVSGLFLLRIRTSPYR